MLKRILANCSEFGGSLSAAGAGRVRSPASRKLPGIPEHDADLAGESHGDKEGNPLLETKSDVVQWNIQADKHDDEHEQHHDAADVENDLRDEQKFGAELEEYAGGGKQRGDQKDGAMNRIAARDHQSSS